jgi:hypothetical protein
VTRTQKIGVVGEIIAKVEPHITTFDPARFREPILHGAPSGPNDAVGFGANLQYPIRRTSPCRPAPNSITFPTALLVRADEVIE